MAFEYSQLTFLEGVYEPREDSLLLAECVKVKQGARVLDLGCGSGIQGINAALQGARVLAVDINRKALENTKKNAAIFKVEDKIEIMESDLFSNVNGKFDAIIFNPPYVPSKGREHVEVDGGKQGREVLDHFLEKMPKHLREHGKCFFLQSSLNGRGATEKQLGKMGFEWEIVGRKKLFFEELLVFKCWKKPSG